MTILRYDPQGLGIIEMFGDLIPEEPGMRVTQLTASDQWDDTLPSNVPHLDAKAYLRLAVHAYEMHDAARAQMLLKKSYQVRGGGSA